MKTIVIAGGTGFLGSVLEHYLSHKDYDIKILTRKPTKPNHIYWNGKDLGKWCKSLEQIFALINLSGKSVDCRYTDKNKKRIYDSRIDSTNTLGLAINLCDHPPKIWLNASTATIYRHSEDMLMTEDNGEIGNDFSMNIAKSWEYEFNNIVTPKTRKVILRTSIVLGKNGGALKVLKSLTNLFLGGRQGSGQQKVSWIHENDFARAVHFIINNKTTVGVYNITAPKPTNNSTLMKRLRHYLNIPFGINHSKWLLELGAFFIGTETELVLKSRNVIPKRLLKEGFCFKYKSIESALKSLC
ncbi:TIGR01777 family oxidoreductase [Ichthyenterobacterium sp. W332]|uniref:TIGR01777 family oxidoreductase n=1 Tax=Microcosmobacter mediterraneus TaxID=3075607 RepID=A0ABU2YJT9_9FLAO|nr:TIGR01777 family oxidoreductase [Ichthyenterobacterium sp. W332]MDT0558421.1 TIGR01777 family oxidoreductase [Ichthyenterobacterium sp. W332]